MKQLQAGDKIVRQMTREGAVELNKATGNAANISTRATGGAMDSPETPSAENVQNSGGDSLYTIGGLVDRVQSERTAAKKRTHRKANAEIFKRSQPKPDTTRLQFTDVERNDPTLARSIRKSDKAADRYERARGKIPKEKFISMERVSDKPSGKTETRLTFRERDKPPNGKLTHALDRPGREAALLVRRKVDKSDNTGVQAAHFGEKTAEGAARKLSAGYRRLKFRPYRAAYRAEKKAIKTNSKALYKRSLQRNPELKKASALKKALHKRHIKKQYAKAFRQGMKTGKAAAVTLKKAVIVKSLIVKAALVVKIAVIKAIKTVKAIKILAFIGVKLFFILLLVAGISSCMSMFGGGFNMIIGTSYTAEDEDILGAHGDFTALEYQLADRIANIASEFPGYDEYRFYLDEIGHDPHELISYLTALYQAFTLEEVQATLLSLFNQQYVLTLTPIVEIRTRQEERTGSWTDGEGNTHTYTYTVTVEYNWYVLVVTLVNRGIAAVAEETLTPEQLEMFHVLMETRGNRPDLFGGEALSIAALMELAPRFELPRIFRPAEQNTDRQTREQPAREVTGIPPATLPDSRFAAMMEEAEQFIGFPYVWGGSNPATSFDCSGFVSWVINQSGAGSVGRMTANGLYNHTVTIPYYEARPGDLIFFQGTFNTRGASHVGIYVGGGRMLHAGDPIGFTSIRTAYWTRHFKAFGRLP